MDLAAHLRFDHQLLAVEREHRVHCLLELTAPPRRIDRAPTPSPGARDRPLRVHVGPEAGDGVGMRRLPGEATQPARRARHRDVRPPRAAGTTALARGRGRWEPRAALRRITPGGATNLSGGWLKGVEQLQTVPMGTGPKKVLLLTDGEANHGVTDAATLVRMARRRRPKAWAPPPSASVTDSTRTCSAGWPTRARATPTTPRRPSTPPRADASRHGEPRFSRRSRSRRSRSPGYRGGRGPGLRPRPGEGALARKLRRPRRCQGAPARKRPSSCAGPRPARRRLPSSSLRPRRWRST